MNDTIHIAVKTSEIENTGKRGAELESVEGWGGLCEYYREDLRLNATSLQHNKARLSDLKKITVTTGRFQDRTEELDPHYVLPEVLVLSFFRALRIEVETMKRLELDSYQDNEKDLLIHFLLSMGGSSKK